MQNLKKGRQFPTLLLQITMCFTIKSIHVIFIVIQVNLEISFWVLYNSHIPLWVRTWYIICIVSYNIVFLLKFSERHQETSKNESFATISNSWKPLAIVAKLSILYICGGPCYAYFLREGLIHISMTSLFISKITLVSSQSNLWQ